MTQYESAHRWVVTWIWHHTSSCQDMWASIRRPVTHSGGLHGHWHNNMMSQNLGVVNHQISPANLQLVWRITLLHNEGNLLPPHFCPSPHLHPPPHPHNGVIALTLSQCTLTGPVYTGIPLECHWLTQCTLGYHWKNLVETAPHWNATGET